MPKIEPKGIYFQLGYKRALWKTEDGKISLSIFPNDKGETHPYGFVEETDVIKFAQVQRALSKGQLTMLQAQPKKMVGKGIATDITNQHQEDLLRQEKALKLLKMSPEVFERALKEIASPKMISEAILFESQGKNKVGKKREPIMEQLKRKLESLGGITEFVEADGTVEGTLNPETQEGLGKTIDQPSAK